MKQLIDHKMIIVPQLIYVCAFWTILYSAVHQLADTKPVWDDQKCKLQDSNKVLFSKYNSLEHWLK